MTEKYLCCTRTETDAHTDKRRQSYDAKTKKFNRSQGKKKSFPRKQQQKDKQNGWTCDDQAFATYKSPLKVNRHLCGELEIWAGGHKDLWWKSKQPAHSGNK